MSAWGVALFADDLAADLRGDYLDMIGNGLSSADAVEKLLSEYSSELDQTEEMPIFWLALAAIQWKVGRLEERTKREALHVIDNGADLKRWSDPANREKRKAILERLRNELLSPMPPPKRVPKRVVSANDWALGEVVGFRLLSKKWILIRVIGHHTDKGGRDAVCELLDWVGDSIPPPETIEKLPIRVTNRKKRVTQFFFQEPRKKVDRDRVKRLGFICSPTQRCGRFTVFVWPYVDRMLKENYDLE